MEDIKALLNNEQKFNEMARTAFEMTDEDKSGVIDIKELESAMSQISSDIGIPAPSKEEVEEIFNVLDQDKSGKIDFNEFKLFVRKILEIMASDE